MHKPQIVKIHVDERCEYRLRREMPWIFDKHADFGKSAPEPGDIVAVYGKRNQCIKLGLCDPYSPIPVRILGNPCEFSENYIAEHLSNAIALRAQMHIADDQTNGIRILSGESEGLPGLVIDAYAGTWVLKIYSACWLPYLHEVIDIVSAYGKNDLSDVSKQAFAIRPYRIILRFGRDCLKYYEKLGFREGSLVFGNDETPYAEFLENGAKFHAQVFQGQKTGFFLDQTAHQKSFRR